MATAPHDDQVVVSPSVAPSVKEDRFHRLVQSVRDYAIFLLDKEGRVETWNPGAEAAKGYLADEIVGKHISVFYGPEDQAAGKPERLLRQAREQGRVEDEGWRVRKDGSRFWADVVISSAWDAQGNLLGYSKVTRDLTARRQAEEQLRQSEERFRVLVQSVQDHAIFMLDPQGHVATWNAGAQRIKGYSGEEIIGQHFSRFYPPEDVAGGKCERVLATVEQEGRFEDEGWRLRKDGTRFWASVVIEPLRGIDGKLLGFAKVTRDLTERHAAELERLALAKAQEAVRMRDEFLSIASHELKTPLTAMQLQLQSLVQASANAEEKLRRRAERALAGGERLNGLVETLLDVSQISAGEFRLEKTAFDLGALVDDVAEDYQEALTRAGCKLVTRQHGILTGSWDRMRVEQIITNLLGNAMKYAAGTPIEIEAHSEADRVVLSVSDAGPGIPASEWQRIFDRFERASSARHFGGLGLGLYVTRQICAAHGGTVEVEAVQPQGARFVVRLPRQAQAAA